MTDEALAPRLEGLLREIEQLQAGICEADRVVGKRPDPDDLDDNAYRCAEALLKIKAQVDCIALNAGLRSLTLRSALREAQRL